jgi:hypothetical protein
LREVTVERAYRASMGHDEASSVLRQNGVDSKAALLAFAGDTKQDTPFAP